MVYCWNCSKNVGTNNFCGNCGKSVVKSDPAKQVKKCNGNGCIEDDTGYAPTRHGSGCPLHTVKKTNEIDRGDMDFY